MRFPSRALEPDGLAPEGESSAGPERAAGRAGGRRRDESDSLGRYLLTALGLFVALGLIALALVITTQAGRASQADPVLVSQSAAAPVAPAPTAAQPQPAAPAPSSGGQVRVTSRIIEPRYVVAPGDTLGSIAAKTGTSIEALQSINNLADRNALSVGQRLVVPNQD